MSKVDLLIKNGNVITEDGILNCDIAVKDEKIQGLFTREVELEADEILDVKGKTVFPGLIDTHAHFWEPGPNDYREDYYHASRACAAGGVTTVCEMPLSVPPLIDTKTFNIKKKIADEKSLIDYAFWGGLIPKSIDNLEEMNELGCIGYKAFISYANENYPRTADHHLYKAMRKVSKFNGVIGVHAENADLVVELSKELEEKGVRKPSRYSDGRPPFTEVEAINRAALFSKETDCKLFICHMSAKEGVEAATKHKNNGVSIFKETCPHYLAFDKSIMDKKGPFAKCNPPIRDKDNLEALWKKIKEGKIDCIGTDHGPYSDEEKLEQKDNIWKALPGFGGVELMLSVMLTEGYHKRDVPLKLISKMISTNAARIFGLKNKGSIRIGKDADFAIVDLNKEWAYDGKKSYSKTKTDKSLYQNYKAKGKVIQTIVRGKTVYKNGKIIADKNYGKYVSAEH